MGGLKRLVAQSVRLATLSFALGATGAAWAATPLAVWNGDFKTTTVNGVTFDANGNTVADDGSYVKISGTKGALFKASSGYNYLVAVFTVRNLNESAAADRVLALLAPNDTAGSNARGVYLASGTVETRGVWNNMGSWDKSNSNTTLRGTLKSGVDTGTERTFAIVTCNANSYEAHGTRLYEVTGDTPSTAVYGEVSNNGLRGRDNCYTLCIGGPGAIQTTDPVVAFTGLEITKVAIYGSTSALPLNASDYATYAYPAKQTVASGDTVAISALNAAAPVWTTIASGATVTVDAESAGNVWFRDSDFEMSGSTVTKASGVALDLQDTALTALTLDLGTARALPTISNVGTTSVSVILDEVSGDNGSITITGGADGYTYKVIRTDGRTAAATYSSGAVTYKNYAAGDSSITLTADANLSDLCGTTDFGAATSTLTVNDDGGDYVLTVDEDMANASITFTGSGTTTLVIADGVTFKAPATFANNGTGSVIVRVDAGGTAEINGQRSFLSMPTKFVLNGGSLVNNGGNVSLNTSAQITNLELTADSTVGGSQTFGLVAANHGDTTLTLNGHTLRVYYTQASQGNGYFYLDSVATDDSDGTIRLDQGILACCYTNGSSSRQNNLNCTVVLNSDYYQDDSITYKEQGDTTGKPYCELFMQGTGSQPTVKNIYATNGKGGNITGYQQQRMLTVEGTLGLPFKATITPTLALVEGSTLKALTSDGAECPNGGFSIEGTPTVYVDVSDITLNQSTAIFTWTTATKPSCNFVFSDNDLRTTYELLSEDEGLYVRQYVARAKVSGVVTPYYSLTDAIQNADENTSVEVFVPSTESAVTVAKDATIALGENNVTINTLTVSEDTTLTLTGSGTFTIGAIAGSGTLSIDAQDTVALSVPVGTTFGSFSCNTKLTVTGTVAKGTTLFTIGSGFYTDERVGTDTNGDVHYTINDGAYVVGKMLYWQRDVESANNSYVNPSVATNWKNLDESEATDCPRTFDTVVFDVSKGSGTVKVDGKNQTRGTPTVQLDGFDFNGDVVVKQNVNFSSRNSSSCDIANVTGATITISDGVTLGLSVAKSGSMNVYGKLVGGATAKLVATKGAEDNNGGIYFKGSMSEYCGVVDARIAYKDGASKYGQVQINTNQALDNSYARWFISTNGLYAARDTSNARTPFGVANSTYKFGSLQAYVSKHGYQGITLEIGEKIDEDSWIRSSWRDTYSANYGGTVKWLASTATFTQAATNSYNVTLAGGGNVYVEKDVTNGGVTTTFIPRELNFTNDGGYLTIDDNNSAIAADILVAVNTTTAGVGLNVTTTEGLSVAAPTALQTGISWKKKGAAVLTLTGVTTAGTVTVAEGAGAVILPTGTTYTLGTDTVVDAGYTTGLKFINVAQAVAVVNGTIYYADINVALSAFQTVVASDDTAIIRFLDDTTLTEQEVAQMATANFYWDATSKTLSKAVAKIGGTTYGSLEAAVADATASEAETVSISLLRASAEAVTLDAKTTVTEATAGLYTGTLSGSGTLVLAGTRESAMSFSNWSGTVVLPAVTSTTYLSSNGFNFNFYGVTGSTVKLSEGMSGQWLTSAAVNPAVEIPADKTFTLGSFSPSFANTFTALKGSGIFKITATANTDNELDNVASWGSGLSAYFRIGDVSEFSGWISTSSDVGIAFGESKPAYNTAGGRFYVAEGQSVSIGELNILGNTTFDLFGGGTLTIVNDVDHGGDIDLYGILTISEGTLSVGTAATPKWLLAYGNSTINLNGGKLAVCRITAKADATATINFNGGTLFEYGAGVCHGSIIGGTDYDKGTVTLNVLAGGAIVETDTNTTITPVMEGVGGLTKKGTGALTLVTKPTFTGAITVEGGTVVLPSDYTQSLGANTVVDSDDGATATLCYATTVEITVPAVTGATPTVTASEGTVTDNQDGTYTVQAGATVTVTWTNNGAHIVTNGSTSFKADRNITVGTNAGSLPTVTVAVAQIDTTYYASLADAVATARSGDTVTLVANAGMPVPEVASRIPSGGSIVIDKNLTIDGNGFVVYGVSDAEILNATGVATPGYDMAADLVNGTNLLGFFVKSGDVTFKDIEFMEFGDMAYVNKFGYTPIQTASSYNGELTLTGVSFSKFNRTAVCVRSGTLTMSGGTISGGTVNKNNGDYFQQPVEVRGGTADISDVRIYGGNDITGNGGGAIVAWAPATVSNVHIDFTGYGIWSDGPAVTVTGGNTFVKATVKAIFAEEGGVVSVSAGRFLGELAVDSDPSSGISLTGGAYDRDVTAYCAAGYKAVAEGGAYNVVLAEVEVEIPSSTTGGATTILVAVPKDCTAATLIDTTNRADGDILKVYDKADECYYTWALEVSGETKTWKPATTFKTNGTVDAEKSKAASEEFLLAGQAVWVTVMTSEPVKLLVTYNATPVEVEVEKGWNLVAPTTPGGTTVSEVIASLSSTITENDAIVIPSVEGGTPKIYNKVNGVWGYDGVEYETKTIRGQEVKVAKPVRVTDDTAIPAGTGVWFVNGGDDAKNINL